MSASSGKKAQSMVRTILINVLILAFVGLFFSPGPVVALDCPHSDTDDAFGSCGTLGYDIYCFDCHLTHGAPGLSLTNVDGNTNLCISCHTGGQLAAAKPFADADRADPYGAGAPDTRTDFQGTSHAWGVDAANSAAGAVSPTNPEVADRLDSGKITCSACHEQHNHNDGYPFMRISNAGSGLCRECHTGRVDDTSPYTTHPIGIGIPAATGFKSPTTLQLESGNVECTTCHSLHYTDSGGANSGAGDGWLLDLSSSSICFDCHDFPTTGSHFNAATGALWPGPETVTFTSNTDYARVSGGGLLPHDASAGSLSQPLPASFRGACLNCHWPHGWQPTGEPGPYDKLLIEASSADLCYTCHDGTVATTANVYTQFDGAATDYWTQNVDNGWANQRHNVSTADQTNSNCVGPPNECGVVSCADCHNPHYVKDGEEVMNPDDTTTAWTQAYATDNTYTYSSGTFSYRSAASDQNPTFAGGSSGSIGAAVADGGNTGADTAASGGSYSVQGDEGSQIVYTVTVDNPASTITTTTTGNLDNDSDTVVFGTPIAIGTRGVTITFTDDVGSPSDVGAATCTATCDDTATSNEGANYTGGSNGTYTVTVNTGGRANKAVIDCTGLDCGGGTNVCGGAGPGCAYGTAFNVGGSGVTITFTDAGASNFTAGDEWTIAVTAEVAGDGLEIGDVWTITVDITTSVAPLDHVGFCLACHDGTTPAGVTMSGNSVNIADDYFGVAGQGKHGATAMSNAGQGVLWSAWNSNYPSEHSPAYAALQCTTCHDGHGSDNIYHLKTEITVNGQQMTTYMGTPYKLPCFGGTGELDCDVNVTGAQAYRQWGAFCSFCHDHTGHNYGAANEDTLCNANHIHGGSNF